MEDLGATWDWRQRPPSHCTWS